VSRTFGELTGDDGGKQKRDESDQVLRVGNRKGSNRRQEKKVVGQGCNDGLKDCAAKSPAGRDDQYGKEE
jgi:hypothetical protein